MFGSPNVKPLMGENPLGKPPSSGLLKKRIFGKPPTGKAANPFGAPASPFPKGQQINAFANSPKPQGPPNLFKRLTGQ